MTRREALLVESDGERIGVEVCGDGTPLVLLHGSGGNRATWWQQVARLADDHLVVLVEARGHGRSTDAAGQTGPRACTRDLDAVRRHLGLDAWHVVGHSLGGWTALRHAVEHSEATLTTVVVSSVGGVFPPVAEQAWAEAIRVPWPASVPLARPPSLEEAWCEAHPAAAHLYQLVGALNPPVAPTAPAVRIREHDLSAEEVAGLRGPVCFVVGEHDRIAPPVAVRAAAEALPGATYDELPGVGHVPFWEDPEGFDALLRRRISGG